MADFEVSYRVGFALEPKKAESFLKPSLIDYAKRHRIDLLQIDPNKPLSEQGPFRCIIHKLYSQQWKNQLQQFSSNHPNVPIIDSPEFVDRLRNRVSMLESVIHLQISQENFNLGIPNQVIVNDPNDFNLNAIEDLGLKFPVIAKPLDANGTTDSHKLRLIFDRDGLSELTDPSVLQEFVNHGGVVFKIYVAGQHVNCVKRKSLGDISEEKLRTLKGSLTFSQVSNMSVQKDEGGAVEKAEMPPQNLISELGRALREALGLNLFNLDVIRDSKDERRYLVIDINYFPGYAKMPSFEPFFTDFLLDVVQAKTG